MIDISKKESCCGCGVCANVCPNGAITMVPDGEGFFYPSLNNTLCIQCDACRKSCAFNIHITDAEEVSPIGIYAVKNTDEGIRGRSSSGGVFTALCQEIISRGGVVYGVKFDSVFNVIHDRAASIDECRAFMGAKYVQSNLNGTYARVRTDLVESKAVLFSGTPCQIAGLRNYMKRCSLDTSNLLTCDLVCHGTASPLIWKEYLNAVRRDAEILSVNFRDKVHGWRHSELRIDRRDHTCISEDHGSNPFSQLFFNHYILRPSCSVCPYTSMRRVGDITIGDFWGIENSMPDFDDDEGISLVLVNTDKGRRMFDHIRGELQVRESTAADCLQPSLQTPSALPEDRDEFWRLYGKRGFWPAVKFYTSYGQRSLWDYLSKKAYRFQRRIMRYITRHSGRTI